MAGKERGSALDIYEKFNWVTMGASLLLIGGAVGTAIALIDAAQIIAIRKYKGRKSRN